ncbi:MAG: Asp-tRNA(Asn)/Glu-tRNA(Gln) amidotransferase GatCAB subunit B, partial [Thermoanaerobaculia bacterium]|nr:Asp-tRNA(Asn)/Glu-tRNA(Gln) amidotransferase GatCAB subunit B [Thermoanaerobaculia bacterium]
MSAHLYETVIGLEIHVQLSTKSKAFCADDATFGGAPNTHTSPVSLAHPGTLPRLNRRAVEYAVRLGLALGCQVNLFSIFDRKNYFYADLPKGYQITQDKRPICTG